MQGGPLGALAGIVLGGVFDTMLNAVNTPETQGTFDGQSGYDTHAYSTDSYQGQRNSFLFSMLVLSSYIIKADGKVMHSEMELVRNMLRQNFGEVASQQGDEILRKLFDEQKRIGVQQFKNTVADCCRQIAMNMSYAQRLQLPYRRLNRYRHDFSDGSSVQPRTENIGITDDNKRYLEDAELIERYGIIEDCYQTSSSERR